MKTVFTFLLAITLLNIHSQITIDFESFNTGTTKFLDGSDSKGGFTTYGVTLPNDYNKQFSSWTGWAISAVTDSVSKGFTNQYAAITGKGALNTATYAVAYAPNTNIMRITNKDVQISGLYINNNAYAYYSMKEGDAFSKKFGGASGNDPDFFKVAIGKYNSGVKSGVLKEVYLADFRPSNNVNDYILRGWQFVDLGSIGVADSLYFDLSSTDVGAFGMNTPAYFCIDQVSFKVITSTLDSGVEAGFSVYPTVASTILNAKHLEDYTIFTTNGDLVQTGNAANETIDISKLSGGAYIIRDQKGGAKRFFLTGNRN